MKRNFNDLFNAVFNDVEKFASYEQDTLNIQIPENHNNQLEQTIHTYLRGVQYNAQSARSEESNAHKQSSIAAFIEVARNLDALDGMTENMQFVTNYQSVRGKNRDAFTFIKEELGVVLADVEQEKQRELKRLAEDFELKTAEFKALVEQGHQKQDELKNLELQILNLGKRLAEITGSEQYRLEESEQNAAEKPKHKEADQASQQKRNTEVQRDAVKKEVDDISHKVEKKQNELEQAATHNQSLLAEVHKIQQATASMRNDTAELAKIAEEQARQAEFLKQQQEAIMQHKAQVKRQKKEDGLKKAEDFANRKLLEKSLKTFEENVIEVKTKKEAGQKLFSVVDEAFSNNVKAIGQQLLEALRQNMIQVREEQVQNSAQLPAQSQEQLVDNRQQDDQQENLIQAHPEKPKSCWDKFLEAFCCCCPCVKSNSTETAENAVKESAFSGQNPDLHEPLM